jgi:hypothetical protein
LCPGLFMRAPSRGQMPGGATVAARACFTRRPSSPHVHRSRSMRTLPSWKSVPEKSCDRSSPRVRAGRADHRRRRRTRRSAAAPLRSAESELIEALAGGPFEWLVPERPVIERLAENEETAVAAMAWMKFQGKPAARAGGVLRPQSRKGVCCTQPYSIGSVNSASVIAFLRPAGIFEIWNGALARMPSSAAICTDRTSSESPRVGRVLRNAVDHLPAISTISVHTPQRWLADGSRIFLQPRPGRPVHRRPLKVRPPT